MKRVIYVKLLIFCLIGLFIAEFGYSQRIIRTNGEKDIRIKEDGSWEYIDKEKNVKQDSMSLFDSSAEGVNPFEIPQQVEDKDVSALMERKRIIYNKLLEAENYFDEEVKRAKDNQKLLKKEKKQFHKGKLTDTLVTLEEIEAELLIFENRQKDFELRHQITKEYIKEVVKSKKELTMKDLASLEHRYEAIMSDDPVLEEENPLRVGATDNNPPSYSFQTYSSNTFLNPPNAPCSVVEKEMDDGRIRIDSKPAFLFSYTHEKLRSYFRDNDFMECDAQLSKFGAYYFVTFHIDIKSKKAKTNYGYLEKNSPIRFQLINGEKVYARNIRNCVGALQEQTGHTEYIATFMIDEVDLKTLARNEIDKIGVLWTSGFEDYEIYHVDFFMEQAKCFKL